MTNKEIELQNRINHLEQVVSITNNRLKKEKYGLVWLDVPEDFEKAENKIQVLEEVKEKSIINTGAKTKHILIEGDNYHALTCLNYTHKEKVDIIYIDPPYNTGSDGFRYRDKRILNKFPDGTEVPKDHPLRHSYWLSFMYKRLELAYNLLKPEGAIFISINEEEYAQLKLLCDRIFLESNYLTTFTVKVRHEDRILKGDKDYHETTELLLLYRKSPKFKVLKRLQDNTSIDNYIYTIEELIDNPETIMLGNKEVSVFKPGQYRIIQTEPSVDNFQKINIRGSIKDGNSSGRFHMKYLEERNHLFNYLYKVPGIGDDKYPFRYFLTRSSEKKANGFYFQGVPLSKKDVKEVPYPNFLDFEEAFNNVGYDGGIEFRNGKKPVDFLKFILSIGTTNKNAVILDFFAGSGSTGQAVMELNQLDGGQRQVILCTNNENNIAHEVTYPRLKNIINGYTLKKNQREILYEVPLNTKLLINNTPILNAHEEFFSDKYKERYDKIKEEIKKDKYVIYGITKNGEFRKGTNDTLMYYKSTFIGDHNILSVSDEDKILLAQNAGYLLALAENTLQEVKSTQSYQIFEDEDKVTVVYFKEEVNDLFVLLESLKEINKKISMYIFSWGSTSVYEDIFEDFENLTLKTIPQPILDIYKKIYRR